MEEMVQVEEDRDVVHQSMNFLILENHCLRVTITLTTSVLHHSVIGASVIHPSEVQHQYDDSHSNDNNVDVPPLVQVNSLDAPRVDYHSSVGTFISHPQARHSNYTHHGMSDGTIRRGMDDECFNVSIFLI